MSPDGGGGGGGGGRPCGCGAAPGSVMLFAIALFALGTLRRRPRA
jgi:MYXO-CTERM domain-containing protein